MNHFWEGLQAGKFTPRTDEQIREFIRKNHFSGKALVELASEDKAVIEESVFYYTSGLINRDLYEKLCTQNILYLPEGFEKYNRPHFILEESEHFKKQNKKPLTIQEKIELFTTPNVWYHSVLQGTNVLRPLLSWGMRHLWEYGFTDERFLENLSRIRKNTGRDILNLLDVGGAMGVMLHDAGELDKNIITHNLTLDVLPTTYDVDKLYLSTAERFPIELKENMDLIVSNMAFLYMPGQALALENCLQSLSVGGEAHLSVDWGKQKVFVPNSAVKMRKQYDRMKKLSEDGFIELKVNSGNYGDHALGYIPENNSKHGADWFPPAYVEIRKLKSLVD